MDFNLIDSLFHYTPEEKPIIHLEYLPDGLYRETHVSSDFKFPPAAPPPFHNTFTQTAPTTSTTTFFDNNPNQTPETKFPLCLPDTKLNEISFQKIDSMETMREMIFRMEMMQPVQIDPESVKLPKRKNVRLSKDPQSVAARHRRERISQRIRVLQRMVPGGTKLDTASMLDETIHYLKFLKKQLQTLELQVAAKSDHRLIGYGNFPICGGSMQMLS